MYQGTLYYVSWGMYHNVFVSLHSFRDIYSALLISYYRADSKFAPSQCVTALLCNNVSAGCKPRISLVSHWVLNKVNYIVQMKIFREIFWRVVTTGWCIPHDTLMAWSKTALSPLCQQWRYCSLAPSHRHVLHMASMLTVCKHVTEL